LTAWVRLHSAFYFFVPSETVAKAEDNRTQVC
jgi:hypothetical protein